MELAKVVTASSSGTKNLQKWFVDVHYPRLNSTQTDIDLSTAQFTDHLRRVNDICRNSGLEPMIWSDSEYPLLLSPYCP